VLVQGISGDRGSLGYFGYAYFVENRDKLKPVAVDGGQGCVTPTDATINDGTYAPLSRPLFIYLRKDAADKPHIGAFIRYYLGAEGRLLAAEVGYIPFPVQVYDLALARFEKRLLGTIFGGSSPQRGPVEAVLAANQ
jgi:phosphate transport system substrate-binding protein